jgi:predicted acylesterase/phospholipase RssA
LGSRIADATRWWLDPERVEGFVHGVFEGGGAKGLLYVGALEGVVRRKLWFSAVAGSSAGAITAAMIAAGMRPGEMRAQMKDGLAVMALPRTWNGLRRVRHGTGLLDQDAVRGWLHEVLRSRSERGGLELRGVSPTFAELHGMTGIDLYVVAVDLSASRVMVLNHRLTPDCNVADAVMASATIPGAFEPLTFMTLDQRGQAVPHSGRYVADGGIASNFPTFVFNDDGFREYARLDGSPDPTPVVGFLLDEAGLSTDDVRDRYRQGAFIGTVHEIARETGTEPAWLRAPRFRPRAAETPRRTSEDDLRDDVDVPERRKAGGILRNVSHVLGKAIGTVEAMVLTPISWLALVFDGSWPWNWPDVDRKRHPHLRRWLTAFRRYLATAPLPVLGGVAAYTVMFWIGFVAVASWLVPDFGAVEVDLDSVIGVALGLLLSIVALVLAAWVWILGLGAFAILRIAQPTLALLGYDLFRTFLQTPAAPLWAGYGPNETLVRLTVPPGLTTLGVRPDVNVEGELKKAEDATYGHLDGVIGSPNAERPGPDV